MPENENPAVIQLLTNLGRDVGQIKTDLAVNTTKTAAIEDHLKTLNGKVVRQEAAIQVLNNDNRDTKAFVTEQQNMKRRKSDNWRGLIEKILLIIIVPLLAALWQVIQYLIAQGVFNK